MFSLNHTVASQHQQELCMYLQSAPSQHRGCNVWEGERKARGKQTTHKEDGIGPWGCFYSFARTHGAWMNNLWVSLALVQGFQCEGA